MSAYTCSECRLDGGWHYDEDGNASRCDNRARTEQAEVARQFGIKQASERDKAAQDIVEDAAKRLLEFSANNVQAEIKIAQLDDDSGVMGRAFTHALREGWIAHTGRTVPSTKKGTHGKPVAVYRSLLRSGERAAS